MTDYHFPIKVGDRVALAPHLDLWMAGCRFGTVTSVNESTIGGRFYFVDLDTERNVTLADEDLLGAIGPVNLDKPFNPHGEKTSDGVVITLGMRVLDYNRRTGRVVRDRHATAHSCRAVNPDVTATWSNPDADPPCHNGWDKPTHWFDVEGDEPGGGGMFDGSRMQSIR